MHEHFVQVVIIIITQNGNTTIDQLIDHASLRTSVAAVHAGLQAIYRAHLFTMSLLPSNLQVRPIVNKWACFSVGGSLQPITNILCAATDVGMHGLLASNHDPLLAVCQTPFILRNTLHVVVSFARCRKRTSWTLDLVEQLCFQLTCMEDHQPAVQVAVLCM